MTESIAHYLTLLLLRGDMYITSSKVLQPIEEKLLQCTCFRTGESIIF